jgi:restriction endonuclease Mrr
MRLWGDGLVLENSIHDALDDLHSGMIPGVDQQPERAIIVTIGWFIRDALKLAKRYADEITLIDGQQLVTMMQRVQPQ